MRITTAEYRKREQVLKAAIMEQMESRWLFTTYYVSPTGSDNNPGTSLETPFKTITQALNVVANDNKTAQSDTILIRGGTYYEQPDVWASDSGASATSRTVISAYTNPTTGQYEPVYINAATPITGTWIQDGTSNRWYMPNFTTMTSGVWVDWSGSNDGASLKQIGTYNDGFADERTVTGSGPADMTPGTYYGDLADSRLYVYLADGSNPNLHSLQYASNDHEIYQPGTPNASGGETYASNIDFVGLKLRHGDVYNTFGQDSGCAMYTTNNERLIDCDIQWNEGTGVILRGTSEMLDCVSSNNGRNGVSAQGTGFLISGGQYDYNYWRLNTDASEAGIKVISNTPVLWGDIENAEIAYNYGKGVWFDTTFENSVTSHVIDNYIHDNLEDGIDLEATKNILVANNVITNNQGDGVYVNAAEDSQIDNNTLVGNHGSATIELDGGSRSQGSVYPGTISTLNDSVENNIISNNFSVYDLDIPTIADQNNTSDYNLIYHSSGSLNFTDGGTYFGWGQTPSTLAAWQKDSGQDTHSIVADPMFVGGGAGALAYQVGANSPAIGEGANLSSTIGTDYAGTARPASAFDIGAIQHSTTTSGAASAAVINTDPTVWVDGQLPANAAMTAPDQYGNVGENRFWQWNTQNTYGGIASLDSTVVAGAHRQYFTNADPRAVGADDNLYAYVWIDPQNMPKQIMLEWQDSSGSWAHQASWGTAGLIGAGVDGSSAAQNMGALPAAGEWVALTVPASTVGLAGKSITGFSFDLYDGRALVDKIGNGVNGGTTVTQTNDTASISGKVFQDNNGSGTLDSGETGLAGRTVFIDLNHDGTDDAGDPTTTTDASGDYSFSKLAPGSYVVRQEIPAGYVASTSSDTAATVTLQPGAAGTQNLGEFPTAFTSSANGDNFTVAETADGKEVEIWESAPESAAPTYQISKSELTTLSFDADGFNTTLTADFSNGSPLASGNLSFDGGSGVSSLTIVGAATAANAVTVTNNTVTVNANSMNISNVASVAVDGGTGNDVLNQSSTTVPVTFNGLSGSDTLNVNAGTYHFRDPAAAPANLDVNVASGASVSFAAGNTGTGISTYQLEGLNIAAGGSATLDAAPDTADRSLLIVDALNVAGTLNVSNNDMIVRDGNAAAVNKLLATGYADGTWTGPAGIVSSNAANDPELATAVGMQTGVAGQFDGQAVSTSDVEMKFTYYGDANLDGKVDASDYERLTTAATSGASGWQNGDFNYDGEIDGADYTLIDDSLSLEGIPLSSITGSGTTGSGTTTTGTGTSGSGNAVGATGSKGSSTAAGGVGNTGSGSTTTGTGSTGSGTTATGTGSTGSGTATTGTGSKGSGTATSGTSGSGSTTTGKGSGTTTSGNTGSGTATTGTGSKGSGTATSGTSGSGTTATGTGSTGSGTTTSGNSGSGTATTGPGSKGSGTATSGSGTTTTGTGSTGSGTATGGTGGSGTTTTGTGSTSSGAANRGAGSTTTGTGSSGSGTTTAGASTAGTTTTTSGTGGSGSTTGTSGAGSGSAATGTGSTGSGSAASATGSTGSGTANRGAGVGGSDIGNISSGATTAANGHTWYRTARDHDHWFNMSGPARQMLLARRAQEAAMVNSAATAAASTQASNRRMRYRAKGQDTLISVASELSKAA